MKNFLLGLSAALAHVYPCHANSRYRSRPDLSPPSLNITIPATSDVGSGFLFVAPYSIDRAYKLDGSSRPEQPAAYIFRDDGDLVWSSVGYISGFVGNFHVATLSGKPVILANEGTIDTLHGHGYGHVAFLDQRYQRVKTVTGGNHKVLDLHEFTVQNGKTAVVEIYDQLQVDLRPYGGKDGQTWIVDAVVQELDLETGKVLFEWHSLDHVDPTDSVLTLNQRGSLGDGRTAIDAWDYFHINSVDKNNTEGNYLISGRHVSAIYKLDGKTGKIIWQIGGKHSNFSFGDELEFAFQHDARFQGRDGDIQYISLFDNGAGSNGHQGGDKDKIRDYSTGKLLKLNTSDWTASIVKEVEHPDRLLAPSQGNTQILPNGNLFVHWGQAGTITEYRANDSVPIFNAYLDTFAPGRGVQNYRGFRQEWKGTPTEPPALVALTTEDGSVELYVSWNGDTETHTWKFYVREDGKEREVGQSARKGFETKFEVPVRHSGKSAEFFARAFDSNGKSLSKTERATIRQKIGSSSLGRLRPDAQQQAINEL
ncbi:hypothetical protein K491DRAFT_766551 [Lophiostoma macrostomum CBS 122681]|uniref:Arylsulfotransferase n=1 Tax=Lophiostoma macrostomum CBS 122681 TaxID=1314788 RepID=A0A6A6TFA7_9PLEO|nr:hypothetical protein K491DRAFT_766551 [Lophiostoma macrostomum CBS 122681]